MKKKCDSRGATHLEDAAIVLSSISGEQWKEIIALILKREITDKLIIKMNDGEQGYSQICMSEHYSTT